MCFVNAVASTARAQRCIDADRFVDGFTSGSLHPSSSSIAVV